MTSESDLRFSMMESRIQLLAGLNGHSQPHLTETQIRTMIEKHNTQPTLTETQIQDLLNKLFPPFILQEDQRDQMEKWRLKHYADIRKMAESFEKAVLEDSHLEIKTEFSIAVADATVLYFNSQVKSHSAKMTKKCDFLGRNVHYRIDFIKKK